MQIEGAELTVKSGKTKEDVEDILEQMEVLSVFIWRNMRDFAILEPYETSFKWDEEAYTDLLLLSQICDGHIEMVGEESEYTWYDIKNGEVKEREGKIVYSDEPSLTLDSNNPIMQKLLFDGVYSNDQIIILNVGYKDSSYILVDRKEIRYMTFYSLTSGLLQLLTEYAKAGESALEKHGWTSRNHGSTRMQEWIDILNERGFETEAVALKLAYQ